MNHRIEVCINRAISVAMEHRNILYLYIISLRFGGKTKQRKKTNTYKDYKKEAEKIFDVVVHEWIIARF
jgi:hypothetical protein